MIYMFCADGLEEVEALGTLDVIRRGGLDVKTVGLSGKTAKGPHDIEFFTDMTADEFFTGYKTADAVILPGGLGGTNALAADKRVCEYLLKTYENGGFLCAICAAPSVLGKIGVLNGKKATVYPGFEDKLTGAAVTGEKVVRDGRIITAKGMGCAIEFGLAIISALKDEKTAEKVGKSIMFY